MIITLFTFTVTVLGGVGAMIAHQTRMLDARFGPRFDAIENRLSHVESELVDVKITIARFEGPQRRFQHL
jgi:hypothetical protein